MPVIPYAQRTDLGSLPSYVRGSAESAMGTSDAQTAQNVAGAALSVVAGLKQRELELKQKREEDALFEARKAATDSIPVWKQYLDDQRKNIPVGRTVIQRFHSCYVM